MCWEVKCGPHFFQGEAIGGHRGSPKDVPLSFGTHGMPTCLVASPISISRCGAESRNDVTVLLGASRVRTTIRVLVYCCLIFCRASTVVLAASNVLSSDIATTLQQQVKTCIEEIQVDYALYSSLEFQQEDLELNIHFHKIIFGFPLPRHYFSRTPDVDIVVNVVKALANRVSSAGAWDCYITRGQEVVLDRETRVRVSHDSSTHFYQG